MCVSLSNEPMSTVAGRVINIPIIWGFVRGQEQREGGRVGTFLLGVQPSG